MCVYCTVNKTVKWPKMYTTSTPRSTYSVDTDVHQPSTLCRDLGVNLGLSFGGPCLGHKFTEQVTETVIAHRSSSGTHKGSDSEGQTHTDHMYRLPPVTFYRSRVSHSCSDSETVHETCCVWEVGTGTGNWCRSLQLINPVREGVLGLTACQRRHVECHQADAAGSEH